LSAAEPRRLGEISPSISKPSKTDYLSEWSTITTWDPEFRYNPIGTVDENDAESMIESAENLLEIL